MKIHMKLGKLLPLLPQGIVDAITQAVEPQAKELGVDVDELDVKRSTRSGEINELQEGERAAVQYVSTRHLDRDKEVVVPAGVGLKEFKLAPQVLWGHDYTQPPIGSDDWIKADDNGVLAKTKYATTERGEEIWTLKREGHLKTSSIGFVPLKWLRPDDGKDFTKLADKLGGMWSEFNKTRDQITRIITDSLLLEHSDVSVPANINALTLAVSKGDLEISDGTLKQLGCEAEPLPEIKGDACDAAGRPLDLGEKPFPNEHSCRKADPAEFDSFRRSNNEFGDGIHAIFGIKDDKSSLQAIRFSVKDFTASEARAWLKGHDEKCILFEPAEPKKAAPRVRLIEPVQLERKRTIELVTGPSQADIDEAVKKTLALRMGRI